MSRVISVFFDVTAGFHRNAAGAQIQRNQFPSIIFREKPIVNLHLVTDGANTPFTDLGASSDVYSAAIDNNFDHADALMTKTLDANINLAGDFTDDSSGNADPTQGEFSIRLDADNSDYETKIAKLQELVNTQFELLTATGLGGPIISAIQMPFRTLNIIDDDGATPPSLVSTFLVSNTFAIGNGDDFVTVTGLGLAFTPTKVICTVIKPTSADLNLVATVRGDSFSTAGFTADLSGATDNANYKLHFVVFA